MLSSRSALAALFCGFAAVAGCAAEADPEAVGSGNADLTLMSVQVLGNIQNGETKTGSYSGGATHRAYAFRATGNDTITADVGLAGGDAVAFLTDLGFNVQAQNDNAGGGSLDSRVTFTVPNGPSRTVNIVFKDKTSTSGNFRVKLGIQAGACSAAAGAEPWHTYHSTDLDECRGGLFIDCPAGEALFSNNCGCGCERPLP